jgi:hypothetical protein
MAAAAHGNGYDPERTRQCVERIEALDRKKEAAHMAYMAECAVFAEDKKAVYEEAKDAWGIKVRSTERKLEAMREDLEPDDQESFDQIRHALGDLADTPLGGAALQGKEGQLDLGKGGKKGRAQEKQDRDAALDAVSTDNGGASLATGLRQLNS